MKSSSIDRQTHALQSPASSEDLFAQARRDRMAVNARFSRKRWISLAIGFLQFIIGLGVIALFFSPLLWAESPIVADKFSISSTAFTHDGEIPKDYTCDGRNVVPPLTIRNIPAKAKSLALIIDDPDAPTRRWTHLAFWNIAPRAFVIPEGKLPANIPIASNDFGQIGYGGPCPSIKKAADGKSAKKNEPHHYHFTVYALDRTINLPRASKRMDLDRMMSGHVIEKAELVGIYQRMQNDATYPSKTTDPR